MTKNYDYRTPRDRIDSSMRIRLEGEDNRQTGLFNTVHSVQRVQKYNSNCGCKKDFSFRSLSEHSLPLAMVYSPYQEFENLYEEEEALCRGTLFKDLDFPFKAYCCGRREYVR